MTTLYKITDNGKLVQAVARFGRQKKLNINHYDGYTYDHITNKVKEGKSVSLGLDELIELLKILKEEDLTELDRQFKEEIELHNQKAEKAAELAESSSTKKGKKRKQ